MPRLPLLLLAMCAALPCRAERPPRALVEDFRALTADQAFYLAAKVAGVAALEGDLQKAKAVWVSYIREFPKQPYAAPAGVQAALVTRVGAGGREDSERFFHRLTQIGGNTVLLKACREISRRWIARSKLEKLHAQLRQYYVKNIDYPDRLEKLVAARIAVQPDLVSPWGKPFDYKLTKSDLFPDVPAQEYDLSAGSLRTGSRKPSDILQEWASLLPRYVLWGVGESTDGRPMALIGTLEGGSRKGGKQSVILGEKLGDLTLIEADKVGAILSGEDYLLVLPQRVIQSTER